MDSPFLGMIVWFGFNFAPRGWVQCNGQLLLIAQNTALFSLLGTYYGGNGTSTFAVPDLRGRLPLHQGQGPGLSNYSIGEVLGSENAALQTANMPAHNHLIASNTTGGGKVYPGPSHFFGPAPTDKIYATTSDTTMAPTSLSMTGSGQAFSILNPSLTLNACIATAGLFPSRN